ncbi:MAG: hypothetical protein HYX74_02700 [Acidobacteria bacterium]|nr:hypothetical protein [Acidobacteriota bacterium]
MAVGGNPAFETVLQIANDVETNNSVIIEVLQGSSAGPANGAPLPVSFDGGPLTASQTVTLAPFQEFTTVLSVADTTPQNGWVRVRSNTTGGKISGNLLFRQRSGGTVIDSVGVSSPQRFRHAIIQVDNREPGSNTGLAFVNPDSTPVTVTIALYQGTRLVSTPPFSQTLQPRQHFAKFVSEMFPSFRREQGTLVIETGAGRSVPYVTLRLDGSQLTSLPVRPLGFTFQYTVRDSDGAVVEAGFWMFDFVGFDLVGVGRRDSDPRGAFFAVSGSWIGTNFQFRYRVTFPDGTTGMAAFKGTSAGAESTVDAGGNRRAVTGTVTTLGADGQARSINNFTAFHKFGPPAS